MEQITNEAIIPPVKPKNWLVESILVTIFCCIAFGIAGIVNAAQVNSRYEAGDYEGALRSSKEAGKWTKIGFFSWFILIAIYVIFVLLFGSASFFSSFNSFND